MIQGIRVRWRLLRQRVFFLLTLAPMLRAGNEVGPTVNKAALIITNLERRSTTPSCGAPCGRRRASQW